MLPHFVWLWCFYCSVFSDVYKSLNTPSQRPLIYILDSSSVSETSYKLWFWKHQPRSSAAWRVEETITTNTGNCNFMSSFVPNCCQSKSLVKEDRKDREFLYSKDTINKIRYYPPSTVFFATFFWHLRSQNSFCCCSNVYWFTKATVSIVIAVVSGF